MAINKGMNKQIMIYLYNGMLHLIKRNELLIHTTIWMNHKIIMLCERSQIEKVYTVLFHLYKILRTAK